MIRSIAYEGRVPRVPPRPDHRPPMSRGDALAAEDGSSP